MKIIVNNMYMHEHCVCYAVVFDTGYFYIGATTKFNQRVKSHKINIKKKPEDYLIGIKHSPRKCIIIKLLLCSDKESVFKAEKALLAHYIKDEKLINKQTVGRNIKNYIEIIEKLKQPESWKN